jgi:hypothetical protein
MLPIIFWFGWNNDRADALWWVTDWNRHDRHLPDRPNP